MKFEAPPTLGVSVAHTVCSDCKEENLFRIGDLVGYSTEHGHRTILHTGFVTDVHSYEHGTVYEVYVQNWDLVSEEKLTLVSRPSTDGVVSRFQLDDDVQFKRGGHDEMPRDGTVVEVFGSYPNVLGRDGPHYAIETYTGRCYIVAEEDVRPSPDVFILEDEITPECQPPPCACSAYILDEMSYGGHNRAEMDAILTCFGIDPDEAGRKVIELRPEIAPLSSALQAPVVVPLWSGAEVTVRSSVVDQRPWKVGDELTYLGQPGKVKKVIESGDLKGFLVIEVAGEGHELAIHAEGARRATDADAVTFKSCTLSADDAASMNGIDAMTSPKVAAFQVGDEVLVQGVVRGVIRRPGVNSGWVVEVNGRDLWYDAESLVIARKAASTVATAMAVAPSKAAKRAEAPCRGCGRPNDVGVTVCWCCGNSPV